MDYDSRDGFIYFSQFVYDQVWDSILINVQIYIYMFLFVHSKLDIPV